MKNNIFIKNKSSYNLTYTKPWIGFGYDINQKKKTLKFILKKANISNKNQKILDIGFGIGKMLFLFDKSCELNGLEISKSAIDYVSKEAKRKNYKNYEFKLLGGNEEKYPFESGKFDIIICSHVLEHVPNRDFLLDEIYRLCAPDGKVIVAVPINENSSDFENSDLHFSMYNPILLKDKLKSHGLNVIFEFQNGATYHLSKFMLNFRKIPFFGFFINGFFEVIFSAMPFCIENLIDNLMLKLGYPPQQIFLVASKRMCWYTIQ